MTLPPRATLSWLSEQLDGHCVSIVTTGRAWEMRIIREGNDMRGIIYGWGETLYRAVEDAMGKLQ